MFGTGCCGAIGVGGWLLMIGSWAATIAVVVWAASRLFPSGEHLAETKDLINRRAAADGIDGSRADGDSVTSSCHPSEPTETGLALTTGARDGFSASIIALRPEAGHRPDDRTNVRAHLEDRQ